MNHHLIYEARRPVVAVDGRTLWGNYQKGKIKSFFHQLRQTFFFKDFNIRSLRSDSVKKKKDRIKSSWFESLWFVNKVSYVLTRKFFALKVNRFARLLL